jgi:hypothetical protein
METSNIGSRGEVRQHAPTAVLQGGGAQMVVVGRGAAGMPAVLHLSPLL